MPLLWKHRKPKERSLESQKWEKSKCPNCPKTSLLDVFLRCWNHYQHTSCVWYWKQKHRHIFVCCLSAPCLFVLFVFCAWQLWWCSVCLVKINKSHLENRFNSRWLLFVSGLLLQCVKNGTTHELAFSKLAHRLQLHAGTCWQSHCHGLTILLVLNGLSADLTFQCIHGVNAIVSSTNSF